MKHIIEPHISEYIDTAIERQRVIFRAEIDHDRGIILEKFQSDLKLMGETVDLKIRETTREVIREEVTPRFEILETKMDMVVSEIQIINKESAKYRKDTDDFKVEMIKYRKDTDDFKVEMIKYRKDTDDFKVEMIKYRKDTDVFKEEMAKYRKDTDDFKVEMKDLRKDYNNHNTRIVRLERAAA